MWLNFSTNPFVCGWYAVVWKIRTCKTVFQRCHAVLSVLSCSSCCSPSPILSLLFFGLALSHCLLFVFALRFAPLALTLHLCSPNSLFPLFVFLITIQSCSWCRLLYVFALPTHYFRCYSSSSLASLEPPTVTVCVFSQLPSTGL